MTRILLLLCLFFAAQKLQAQATHDTRITGIVSDTTTKGIDQVSVALISDTVVMFTTKTNGAGAFSFSNVPPGNYQLRFTMVGFAEKALSLTLTSSKQVLDMGTIRLSADNRQLGEITVTAQKALIEDKGDRLVYNAEKDISNAGGTAADVLRKVPTITVDLNGNVQMRGNGNIKILVNGKPSAMMARNLADALRQMPANIIKSVEVITSPGAKYDAEGAAGVINIITKKGLQGFNGSVNATAGNMNRSLGTNISYRKKKIGLTLSATGYQNRHQNESSSVRTSLINGRPQNILYRSSKGDNTGTGGYGEMSLDYDPDSTSHINFASNVWGGDFPNNSEVFNRLTDLSGNVIQLFRTDSRFKNPYGNGQLDLGYTKTFKKADQEFSLLTQFSRMPDNYFYDLDRFEMDQIVYREKSTNYSRNREYTIQADYTHPFQRNGRKDTSKLKLEIGTKSIIRDIGSEFRVDQALNGQGELEPDPTRSNDFDYLQKVYSGYTSFRFSNQRKWNLNAGARFEHTEIEGNFLTTGTKINTQYNNLIPNVMLSKGIKTHTLKASYTQRITRPLIWYLNPWLNQSDPKNVSTGNPDLRPELNHMAEFSHSVSTPKSLTLNSSVYLRLTDNAIEYLSVVNTEGVSTSRPENIAQRKVIGVNMNFSSKPNKNLNLNGSGDVRHIDIRSKALGQENSGWMWYISTNTTYKLPKEFTLQAYASLNSGWLSLQRRGTTKGYWYGFSGKHMFWDKKASLTLSLNNPFQRGIVQKSEESAPTFYSESSFLWVSRSVRLTFEWRFGQMNAEGGKQGKKIKNDDSGR
jgi:outer membrane receptor protein involved in Fe transport